MRRGSRKRLGVLTDYQLVLLRGVAEGKTDQQIADEQGISKSTVHNRLQEIRLILRMPLVGNLRVLMARWWIRHYGLGVSELDVLDYVPERNPHGERERPEV
jgi:DNA-binding CsgD family transcriptional regulator